MNMINPYLDFYKLSDAEVARNDFKEPGRSPEFVGVRSKDAELVALLGEIKQYRRSAKVRKLWGEILSL